MRKVAKCAGGIEDYWNMKDICKSRRVFYNRLTLRGPMGVGRQGD